MKYISTRNNQIEFEFKNVFIKGLADDGGLYVPKNIKRFSSRELLELKNLSYNQLSTEIIKSDGIRIVILQSVVGISPNGP